MREWDKQWNNVSREILYFASVNENKYIYQNWNESELYGFNIISQSWYGQGRRMGLL